MLRPYSADFFTRSALASHGRATLSTVARCSPAVEAGIKRHGELVEP